MTKASQSEIGVSGLFLLGGKRDQRAGCIERAYLDDTSDDGGTRRTNDRHRPCDLYPAYAARCRKLWRKQGRHWRDVQSEQIVPLKYGAQMSRVSGLVRRMRDDGPRSAVARM